MSKSHFYLSQCEDAASKSPMCFNLGAVLVKGGKIISSGYNHHRTHYDGGEPGRRGKGHRKPVSMHAEMHAIFVATGMSPAFKKQVAAKNRQQQQSFDPPLERPRRFSAGPRPTAIRNSNSESEDCGSSAVGEDYTFQSGRQRSFQQQQPKVEGWQVQAKEQEQVWSRSFQQQHNSSRSRSRVCVGLSQ